MNQKGQIEILFILLFLGILIITVLFSNSNLGKESSNEPENGKGTPAPAIVSPRPTITGQNSQGNEINDTTPPIRTNPLPKGELPSDTRKINISLKTDENANCRYSQISGLSYDSMMDSFKNTGGTAQSTEITTLSEGQSYIFYVRCADLSGNKNTDDFEISFKVKFPQDITPPERRHLLPEGLLDASTTNTQISVSTDEKANCYYSIYTGKDFWSNSRGFQANNTYTFHKSVIFNLVSGNIYDYFVRCCDFSRNCNEGDVLIRFGVGIMP